MNKPAREDDNEPDAASAPKPLRPRGSNQVGMRQFNERVVLHSLRLHGALPKADLARLTGLTAQTIGLRGMQAHLRLIDDAYRATSKKKRNADGNV